VAGDDERWSDAYGPRGMSDIFGELEDIGAPPPEAWDRYDLHIDTDGNIEAIITDNEGESYALTDHTDFGDDEWYWVWDLWDWIDDSDYDIDEDTHYKEV
jgi:hypothetical protein